MLENYSETKALMASTLKELIKTKPFSKVTVSDIVSACNINRNTFYYHFDNSYDLLYFAYEQEIQNIIIAFQQAKAEILQALDFVLDYIDKNIALCQCAYDSLGENELMNMYEKDLRLYTSQTVNYMAQQENLQISQDFSNFITLSYTGVLSTQIVWYIKHNQDLDKVQFKEYVNIIYYLSLKAAIREGAKKGL